MLVTVNGSTFVKADRDVVWAALHDLDIIAPCIPGCCSLTQTSERSFALALHAHFGPIALAFEGQVDIAESDPPRSYCLVGHGRGGGASRAAGRIQIDLAQWNRGCRVSYTVQADTQGPFTYAGRLLLTGVGRTISRYFATRFGELVGARAGSRAVCDPA